MAFIRRVRTGSGATAVQIAEYANGRQRIVAHVGSAHTEAELGVLLEQARELLADPAQGVLGFDVHAAPAVAPLVGAAEPAKLIDVPGPAPGAVRDGAGRVLSTDARLLYDALAGIYADLGFDALGDRVFADLVIARVVEPTSLLDVGRILRDLGRAPASYATMKRALARAGPGGDYRDRVAAACFAHARASGDITLCLYDVTTLYFEAEKEDDLRKVGYSKERRVDPQIVVGLLVDRGGFPLEIGCFEGNKAETTTILPIITAFQARHGLADMVVVADAGMLSAGNLRKLDEASMRFIVGSRVTKAPVDLASHFHWHGDAFTDGQLIDTITPRVGANTDNDPALRAEPVWDAVQHPGSWRAVWAYSRARSVRDNKTLTEQENRARGFIPSRVHRRQASGCPRRIAALRRDGASLRVSAPRGQSRRGGGRLRSDEGTFTAPTTPSPALLPPPARSGHRDSDQPCGSAERAAASPQLRLWPTVGWPTQ